MGKLQFANASSEAAALETVIGIASPDNLVESKNRRVYLHEITISPRGADFAADVQLYLSDTFTGAELVTNGTFTDGTGGDSGWTKGTGWTIAANKASKATAATTALSQEITAPVIGDIYQLKYGIVKTANGITPSFGGDTAPADVVTGSYVPVLVAASAEATLAFTADATADCDLDDISLIKYGSNVTYVMHDTIRSGEAAQYKRTFETKQPWSRTGWSLYATTGGASCLLDITITYEVV
jgi:hypothetical protein